MPSNPVTLVSGGSQKVISANIAAYKKAGKSRKKKRKTA